jgi:hypothetical protein
MIIIRLLGRAPSNSNSHPQNPGLCRWSGTAAIDLPAGRRRTKSEELETCAWRRAVALSSSTGWVGRPGAGPRVSLPRPSRLPFPPCSPPLLLRETDGPARGGGDGASRTRYSGSHGSQAGEIANEPLALDFDVVEAGLRTGAGESEKVGVGHWPLAYNAVSWPDGREKGIAMNDRGPWTGHLTKPAQVCFCNEGWICEQHPISDGRMMSAEDRPCTVRAATQTSRHDCLRAGGRKLGSRSTGASTHAYDSECRGPGADRLMDDGGRRPFGRGAARRWCPQKCLRRHAAYTIGN